MSPGSLKASDLRHHPLCVLHLLWAHPSSPCQVSNIMDEKLRSPGVKWHLQSHKAGETQELPSSFHFCSQHMPWDGGRYAHLMESPWLWPFLYKAMANTLLQAPETVNQV